jgi:hypothetical protein
MRRRVFIAAAAVGLGFCSPAVAQDDAVKQLTYCEAIAAHLPEGTGTAFLTSYESSEGGPGLDSSLENAAFVYDNALAAIALSACGNPDKARRIADALIFASHNDRHYQDGRLRNAYRSGAVIEAPVRLPGLWDAAQNQWVEEPSQVGTSFGNVAWAALALLNVCAATGDAAYRDGAARLLSWIVAVSPKSRDNPTEVRTFPGGFFGHEPDPVRLTWISTEHNVDLFATFRWLAELSKDDPVAVAAWSGHAASALTFVQAMFDQAEGRFLIGTDTDGRTRVKTRTGLDAQLWPLLAVPDAPPEWARALAWAEGHHGVDGGFDFNDDRDGVWLEGTAQAALVYRLAGQAEKYNAVLRLVASHRGPSGYVFATSRETLTTGLAVSPQSTDADFLYHRWPHLGATAWAALAESGWNPFTGKRIAE